jgi:hypothetical protein
MRKLWIALVAAAGTALAVAGVANAVNTYRVTPASSSPTAKGSLTKPVPISLRFGFEVGDTQGLRPIVIDQYRIAAEGLQSFPDARPTCTFAQATDPAVTDPANISRACKRAKVGSGTIDNEFGAPLDRTQKGPCDVRLTLYNISTGDTRPEFRSTNRQVKRRGGIAIRVDTYQPEGSRCPIPVHEALAAPFYDVKIQGVSTAELRFRVPDTLKHPSGLDNSLVDVVSNIQKKTGRDTVKGGKVRRVGFYSAVGRKGAKRTVRVTFIDESGDKQTATAQD